MMTLDNWNLIYSLLVLYGKAYTSVYYNKFLLNIKTKRFQIQETKNKMLTQVCYFAILV